VEHQTYWVTVVAVIPVLAIASILEIRSQVTLIVERAPWPSWRKRVALLYWVVQTMVTALLLTQVPQILDDIYRQKDPSDHTLISWGLTLMTTMVAFTPFNIVFRNWMDVTWPDEPPAGESSVRRPLEREARRIKRRAA
jgi:hypothetical protein